ncbi:4,5-DOPA dioxygenase extradiol [Anaerotalea alkaliphila]|uniref:4,5-DOPA dioxygenase extradiol n=1 Tax=Anaerotalea alkaliphila TaxID=2662126 RepID=A0A7X5HU59_9FIRM|nr:4,5-DOPA dioxygenase extradiol [Anaerotalea alkaliphila]NDL66476.1 4,5-DOPA dioxygenase extradiol [Anaerotalea alkaliphila]
MMKMPVLFIGHGSPMNAVEDNSFTRSWEKVAEKIPRPKAILSVSAHWYTEGTRVLEAEAPRTIHDMYGFPRELYEIVYDAPGAPELARRAKGMLPVEASTDNSWGIDHGTWSVLQRMYPERDIPVFQVSVDATAPPEAHLAMGRSLQPLREEGVLILGSGNVVHNLRLVDFHKRDGFPWADMFDRWILDRVRKNGRLHRPEEAADHGAAGEAGRLAVPTPDHFYPLLYVLGAAEQGEQVEVFNESRIMGSVSMTCYLIG